MKIIKLLSTLILLMLFICCKPNIISKQSTLHTTSDKMVGDTRNLRFKRAINSEPQYSPKIHPNILTINRFSLPEKDRRRVWHTWDAKNSSYQIFYLPISSNNLSQHNLDLIISKLCLGKWINDFPLHTKYAIMHYYKEGSSTKDNTCYPVKAQIDETIELDFKNPLSSSMVIFKDNGNLVDSGEPCRYIINTKSFADSWVIDDWDVESAKIRELSSPLQVGDTVHILFIQVIQFIDPENSELYFYLNPINLDNLNVVSYTITKE